MKAAKTRALNAKHAGTKKHAGTAKHTPAATKKTATAHKAPATRAALSPKAAKARALGDCASCCAEAVVASLRLSGRAVAPEDVLTLYRYTADGLIEGASIRETLEAALAHGVAGVHPASFSRLGLDDFDMGLGGQESNLRPPFQCYGAGRSAIELPPSLADHGTSVILGLDLPEGPHAVTLDPSGAVWSWGSLYEMTDEAVVEEAWAVTW